MTSLSRPSRNDPFGKCTEVIKASVPFEIKEKFARMANELGLTESEMLREIIMVRVLGVDAVRRLYDERVALVAGIGLELVQGRTNGELS